MLSWGPGRALQLLPAAPAAVHRGWLAGGGVGMACWQALALVRCRSPRPGSARPAAKEIERLQKQRAKLEKELEGLQVCGWMNGRLPGMAGQVLNNGGRLAPAALASCARRRVRPALILHTLLSTLQARLSNKKFTDKAPPAVVAEVQAAAAEAAEQLAAVADKVAKFEALA